MKKIVFVCFVVALVIASGCSNYQGGELTGVPNRPKFYEPDPFGMVFIPQGSFTREIMTRM